MPELILHRLCGYPNARLRHENCHIYGAAWLFALFWDAHFYDGTKIALPE